MVSPKINLKILKTPLPQPLYFYFELLTNPSPVTLFPATLKV